MTDPVPADEPQAAADTAPEVPAGPLEPARQRRARHAHRLLLYVCAIIVIVLLIAVIVLSAANARAVKLDWVFGSTEISLVWVVLGATVTGWVIGVITATLFRFRTRRRSR